MRASHGWIKSCLPVLFRTDSFKTQIDYKQFQKFLLAIDSFGPNKCGKYGLKSFGILGFSPHTHLCIESAMWFDNILPTLLEKYWLMFLEILIDSFKTQIDYRQFQKFLLVIDSFGPNRCGKYGLKSFSILGFSPHTHLSLLYIESAMRVDDILQHCLKNIDLCFWKFW